MKGGGGNFRFVSFRLDLAREPMSGNLLVLTGPGETADFEFTPGALGDLRLEVKTQLPGWIIPIVRAPGGAPAGMLPEGNRCYQR